MKIYRKWLKNYFSVYQFLPGVGSYCPPDVVNMKMFPQKLKAIPTKTPMAELKVEGDSQLASL